MPARRSGAKTPPSGTTAGGPSPPLVNALLLGAAIAYGISLLVTKGRVSWPPHELLASIYTVAGCLAIVGPVILARGDAADRGLGELLWMTGGLLVWVFDAAGLLRGGLTTRTWATPLGYETMGLTMLAVLVAGWRCSAGVRSWSWTNVTGWILGIYWVAMAFTTLLPARFAGLASR
jgi:hypothetical protein